MIWLEGDITGREAEIRKMYAALADETERAVLELLIAAGLRFEVHGADLRTERMEARYKRYQHLMGIFEVPLESALAKRVAKMGKGAVLDNQFPYDNLVRDCNDELVDWGLKMEHRLVCEEEVGALTMPRVKMVVEECAPEAVGAYARINPIRHQSIPRYPHAHVLLVYQNGEVEAAGENLE